MKVAGIGDLADRLSMEKGGEENLSEKHHNKYFRSTKAMPEIKRLPIEAGLMNSAPLSLI
jgi:hypothetical protein